MNKPLSLFEDTYYTIESASEGLFKDRGSKFLCFAYPVTSEEEIKIKLKVLKKEHHSAAHHCFAYRLGADKSAAKANDDGEPSNTAGKPILNQIQARDLTDILVVVVRYFGGTLLGVNGLINAYKNAAAEALNKARIIEKTVNDVYEIKFDYLNMNDVMRLIKEQNLILLHQNFDQECCLTYSVRKNKSGEISEMLRKISKLEIKYIRTE